MVTANLTNALKSGPKLGVVHFKEGVWSPDRRYVRGYLGLVELFDSAELEIAKPGDTSWFCLVTNPDDPASFATVPGCQIRAVRCYPELPDFGNDFETV